MAMATAKTRCSICSDEANIYFCRVCSKDFCFDHLLEHEQLDEIQNGYKQFRQILIDQKNDPKNRSLIKQINKWEENSIKIIKKTADKCRQILIKYTNKLIIKIENKLNETIESFEIINKKIKEYEFTETYLDELKTGLKKLQEELDKPANVSIEQESTSFINKIFVNLPLSKGNNQNSLIREFILK
jgi:hypothetical protein